ncbi:probable G-protein coupled receptor B0563.6 [Mya arenaria]|uniref:probable G-protein coupled receptor B0563.6 n=1 Tax=Mya arenaria TaxID=6604 RepID=UPI0022E06E96|nr:probable G-protein coupled receptor B0563.6 [Mya arenaria]
MEVTTSQGYNVDRMEPDGGWNTSILNVTQDNYSDYYYSDSEYMDYPEYRAANSINEYYLYVICGIGIPGNIACLVTLTLMRPFTSSDVYMMTLAVADMLALIIKMLFLKLTEYNVQLHNAGCQVIFLLGTTTQTYANWVLVLLTFERFVAVWFPLRVKNVCRKRNSVCVLFVLLVFFIGAHLHFLFTFEEASHHLQTWMCQPKVRYVRFITNVWYWIDGALYALLPTLFIFIFNGLIISTVWRSSRAQRYLTNGARGRPEMEAASQQRQITAMLLVASVVFVILILPNCVFFIVKDHVAWRATPKGTAQYHLVQQIVFVLSDLSHAVNFYLYCVSGRKFRQKFLYLICSCRHGKLTRGRQRTISRDVSRVPDVCASTGSTSLSIFTISPKPSPLHCSRQPE